MEITHTEDNDHATMFHGICELKQYLTSRSEMCRQLRESDAVTKKALLDEILKKMEELGL